MKEYHEIVKVPDNAIAWIYIHSENKIRYVEKHWHRSIEMTYVLKGSGQFSINGSTLNVQAGDLVLINDGDVHSCLIDFLSGNDAISVIIPYSFISAIHGNIGKLSFTLDTGHKKYPVLINLFREMYETFSNKLTDPYYQFKLNAIINDIVYLLYKYFYQEFFIKKDITSKRYQERCQLIVQYIDEHFQEELSLQYVATLFGISKEHLARTFKDYIGITFKNYLTKIRMDHAFKMLVGTDLTLTQISLDSGFSDCRSFIQNFKKVYGTTPLKYRKKGKPITLSNAPNLFIKNPNTL